MKLSVLGFLAFVEFSHSKVSLKGYNEPCELYDTTSSCDDSKGLLCIDYGVKGYRCKCPTDKQFETLYDTSRNKCVGKAFNSCVRDPSSPASSHVNSTLCVLNAECLSGVYYMPICICKKGFFETDDGTCAPAADFGESCDNDKLQCDLKNGLSCLPSGKCGCFNETNNQFYDPQEEKCVTYVGGNCSLDESLCVTNAECRKLPNSRKIIPIPNSPRRRTIIFGSSDDGDGMGNQAEISFSNSNSNRDRNPPTPTRTGYRPLSGSSAGSGSGDFVCLCKHGYSAKDGFCMKSHGSICKMMEKNSTEMCSPDQFLECLDAHDGHFRCQCRNPLSERWDDVEKACVARIGRKCRASPAYPSCESGAECTDGFCNCKAGTSNANGGCKLDYNAKCQPGQCNLYRGLTCHGKTGTCLCLDSYLKYDVKRKSCVADVGAPCGNVDIMGIKGFPGRGMDYSYRYWSIGGNGNKNGNSNQHPKSDDDDLPFIECETRGICKPFGRKSHKCVATD